MNRDNMNALIAHLKSIKPIEFSMNSFHKPMSNCGTACCVAGHAALLKLGEIEEHDYVSDTIRKEAQEWLELGYFDSDRLFYARWPASIMNRWNLTSDTVDQDGMTSVWKEGNRDALCAAVEVLEWMMENDNG